MEPAKIRWYSISCDLAVIDHDPVSLDEALQIADQYFRRTQEKVEDGEDAIAATMFGFGSNREFIEFCINAATNISYLFEAPDKSVPWFLKPWKGIFQHQEQLSDRDAMMQRIRDFFSYSPDVILDRYKRQHERDAVA